MTIQTLAASSSFNGSRYSGLAGEEGDHRTPLEQASRIALAHEFYQIGAEGDVEDRLGVGGGNRLHHGAGVDLALRRPLLVDPLDVGQMFSDISFLNTATADWPYS